MDSMSFLITWYENIILSVLISLSNQMFIIMRSTKRLNILWIDMNCVTRISTLYTKVEACCFVMLWHMNINLMEQCALGFMHVILNCYRKELAPLHLIQWLNFLRMKCWLIGRQPLGNIPSNLSALLQLHLHSRPNHWPQWIGQGQPQDKRRNTKVLGLGACYIGGLMVITPKLLEPLGHGHTIDIRTIFDHNYETPPIAHRPAGANHSAGNPMDGLEQFSCHIPALKHLYNNSIFK